MGFLFIGNSDLNGYTNFHHNTILINSQIKAMREKHTTEIHKLDDKGIAKAVRLLRAGEIVAFPTETVYGLGADATSDTAIAKIYAAKDRPSFNPLIVHVPDIKTAEKYAVLPPIGQKLANGFWPGALTLVLKLKANSKLSKLVTAGLDTVAIRIPAHAAARDLLRVFDRPIAAPSANASGKLSPSEALHVKQSLGGRIPFILDGGSCAVGLESTILDVSGSGVSGLQNHGDQPILLRPGGIVAETIEAVSGCRLLHAESNDKAPKSPGMSSRHYAPSSKIRLNVKCVKENETLIGFGNVEDAKFNLSETGDMTEAAANLFRILHQADKMANGRIAISPIPDQGLGLAINDRLKRAAGGSTQQQSKSRQKA